MPNMPCNVQSAGLSAITTILISSADKEVCSYTIFTQQIDSLREQLQITSPFQSTEFITAVQNKLPITATYAAQGNKISALKVIQ